MSSAYELYVSVELETNVSNQAISVLQSLINAKIQEGFVLPEHEFFQVVDWEQTFRIYTTMTPFSSFSFARLYQDSEIYYFSVRTIGKGEQIYTHILFLQWISQHSISNGFIGYYYYEDSFVPTLFALKNKKLLISSNDIDFNAL